MQRIDAPLLRQYNQVASGGLSYRNPIKIFFWSFNYTYSNTLSNLLYSTELSNEGSTILRALKQENYRTKQTITTRASKYIGKLNSNVTLTGKASGQNFQQVLNDKIINVAVVNLGAGSKVETDFTHWFGAEYQVNWQTFKNKLPNQDGSFVGQHSHFLNMNIYPI